MRFPVESVEPCTAPTRAALLVSRDIKLLQRPGGEPGRSALSSGPNPMPEHSAV